MAVHIRTNGDNRIVQPTRLNRRGGPGAFTLDELQHFVGGYIERVGFVDGGEIQIWVPGRNTIYTIPLKGAAMYVNEEGQLRNLPINETATHMVYRDGGTVARIVGDVVVLSAEEEARQQSGS